MRMLGECGEPSVALVTKNSGWGSIAEKVRGGIEIYRDAKSSPQAPDAMTPPAPASVVRGASRGTRTRTCRAR
jgi:hypothetical protein